MIFRIVLITLSFSLILLSCTKKNELIYKNFKTGIQSTFKENSIREFLKKEYLKNE